MSQVNINKECIKLIRAYRIHANLRIFIRIFLWINVEIFEKLFFTIFITECCMKSRFFY